VRPNILADKSADRSVLAGGVTKEFDTEKGPKRLETRHGQGRDRRARALV
jgi:hypothetical protein